MSTRPSFQLMAMEARSVDEIPHGGGWQYEPKWDGFRCLLARTGQSITLSSKSGQDLRRYFPEIAAVAAALPAKHFILDGEIVVPDGRSFSFDALLQRIHPAASRVARLSAETPALFLAFDLLKRGASSLASAPLAKRRLELEDFAARCFGDNVFRLSPASRKIADARRWLASAGEGSDGVIAKRIDLPYQAGNRDGMRKIKRYRSADCVIGGFRYGERKQGGRKVVGSILLGLYDKMGDLHHIGFCSGIKAAEKHALTDRLEAIAADRSFTASIPGGPSRWSTARSAEWQPVKPKFVVEVPAAPGSASAATGLPTAVSLDLRCTVGAVEYRNGFGILRLGFGWRIFGGVAQRLGGGVQAIGGLVGAAAGIATARSNLPARFGFNYRDLVVHLNAPLLDGQAVRSTCGSTAGKPQRFRG